MLHGFEDKALSVLAEVLRDERGLAALVGERCLAKPLALIGDGPITDESFEAGGVGRQRDADAALQAYVQAAAAAGARTLLFQDLWSEYGDEANWDPALILRADGNIYVAFDAEFPQADYCFYIRANTVSYQKIGYLVAMDLEEVATELRTSGAATRRLADSTSTLIASAFDDEGWLIAEVR